MRARRLYYVGGGGSSWRDPRNWSRAPGGPSLRHFHARGGDVVVLAGGVGSLDLRGMPCAGLEVRGYEGLLRLPDGQRVDLRVGRRGRLRRRLSRVAPPVPAAVRAAVARVGGWRETLRSGLAVLAPTRRGWVLVPRLSGGVSSWFWVGGTGTWDGASTTHWASSTGGAGGAGVPASGDTVTFDGNSGTAATVTVASGAVCTSCTVNKSDITLTWSGATTFGGTVTHTLGTINTAGKTVSWGAYSAGASGTRTLTLGASPLTLTGIGGGQFVLGTNVTITTNTATLTFSGGTSGMSATAINLNGASIVATGAGVFSILGGSASTITCASFTRTGTAAKTDALTLATNLTCTGTFTANGNSVTNRLLVNTNSAGARLTITAAAVTCTNVDFQLIAGAGAGSWDLHAITGNSGDCGGNSGITFTAPSTQTWSGTSGGNWSTNAWTTHVPLPQDTARISAAFIATQTVTLDMPRTGSVDFTGVSGSVTFSHSASIPWLLCGSLTYAASGMTVTAGGQGVTACGPSSTLTPAGQSVATTWNLGPADNSSVTLAGGFNVGTNPMNISGSSGGTIFLGAFTHTATTMTAQSSWTGTIDFGGGATLNLSGTGTVFNLPSGAATANVAGSAINLTDTSATSRTFAGGSNSYGTLSYTAAGSGALTISGSNTFSGLNLQCATARTITLTSGTTQTVTSTCTLQGASGQLLSLAATSTTTATLVLQPGVSYSNTFTSIGAHVVIEVQASLALAGGSSLAATLIAYRRFTVSVAGVSSLTASVVPTVQLVLSIVGHAALTAAVAAYQRIVAALAGVGFIDAMMQRSFDQHNNFVFGIVAAAPTPPSSGQSLGLQSGQGASFPDPSTVGGQYDISIWPAGALQLATNSEIARVTARSGDTLTITRAVESSSARTIQVGDWVAMTVTAKQMQDVENRAALLSGAAFAGDLRSAGRLLEALYPYELRDGGSPATYSPDLRAGNRHVVSYLGTAGSLTIGAPLNSPPPGFTAELLVAVKNYSAASASISWNSGYRTAGFALPATVGAGETEYARFWWDGTSWVCAGVSTADFAP